MIDYMQKGGPLMWLLLFCSILGGAVFLERSLFYFRVTLHLGDFMRGISNLIRHQRWSEAQVECASFSTPVTRVLHAAVLRHGAPREELRAIVQEAGQLEVLRLEQNLGLISGIGLVAPLIGLLGTVTGMIEVFSKISSQSGLTSSTDLAAGIYQSLLTTAGGLVVAIPCSIGYAYLSSRVNALMRDMERAGIEVVNLIMDSRVESQIIEFGSASKPVRQSRPSTGAAE
jgi:biopolymer transport protein ExbB